MAEIPGPRELTPEQEEEMIEKIASLIHRSGLGTAAILFIESVKPLSNVAGQLTMFTTSAFLPLLGTRGYDFLTLIQNRDNIEKLTRRIEELMEEEEKAKEEEKKAKEEEKKAKG